jgi:Oligopeptide/dipeptide transporter, C-terminal region
LTLVLNPRVIIFDEPTAGLDVSVQATILRFFKQMQREFDLTYLFISHDLGIIRLMCHRVTVMYLGAIVESGAAEEIFQAPTHPYTRALLAAVPKAEVGPWEGTLLQGEPLGVACDPARYGARLGISSRPQGVRRGTSALGGYAGDLAVLCPMQAKAIEAQERLRAWLRARGRRVADEQTPIRPVRDGFKCLAFNSRHDPAPQRSPSGLKRLITPSPHAINEGKRTQKGLSVSTGVSPRWP